MPVSTTSHSLATDLFGYQSADRGRGALVESRRPQEGNDTRAASGRTSGRFHCVRRYCGSVSDSTRIVAAIRDAAMTMVGMLWRGPAEIARSRATQATAAAIPSAVR
jgi:hypothetical protein